MCDLVSKGKGNSITGSFAGSGEEDLSNRSTFAIGMAEIYITIVLESSNVSLILECSIHSKVKVKSQNAAHDISSVDLPL